MKTFITAITFIWSGLLIGISFMEAPLKFTAPNITTELGLGIGKVVFTALNRVEILIVLCLIIALYFVKANRKTWLSYSLPLFILLIQSVWLLPVLNVRIDNIVAEIAVPPSKHHIIFIVLEVIKLISVLIAGTIFTKNSTKQLI
ncbi:MAG: hypothetical protein ACPG5B_11695 [Chitinophagales bacterium]